MPPPPSTKILGGFISKLVNRDEYKWHSAPVSTVSIKHSPRMERSNRAMRIASFGDRHEGLQTPPTRTAPDLRLTEYELSQVVKIKPTDRPH
jgi:hypothetical protein